VSLGEVERRRPKRTEITPVRRFDSVLLQARQQLRERHRDRSRGPRARGSTGVALRGARFLDAGGLRAVAAIISLSQVGSRFPACLRASCDWTTTADPEMHAVWTYEIAAQFMLGPLRPTKRSTPRVSASRRSERGMIPLRGLQIRSRWSHRQPRSQALCRDRAMSQEVRDAR
jgi:hypothetical protein